MAEDPAAAVHADEGMVTVKREFLEYIEKNILEISSYLPVFYGHVVATLDNSFPDLDTETYDEFIDLVTYKILDTSEHGRELPFVEKVIGNALRFKKGKDGKMGLDIMAGMRLLKSEEYAHAIPFLQDYTDRDAMIAAAVAYSYYMLSLREMADGREKGIAGRPGEHELLAREEMLRLAQRKPPIHGVRALQVREEEEPWLKQAFWLMLTSALEWLPGERGLIEVGLEKATQEGNRDMKVELLRTANERFSDDMPFLREMYHFRLEQRDGTGAASVVRQMMQQFPDSLEPVYYGLKLSLLSGRQPTYDGFRNMALQKGMDSEFLRLQDLCFTAVSSRKQEALAHLQEIRRSPARTRFFYPVLDYLVQDIFGEDPQRSRRARRALLDSVDRFTRQGLAIPL
ncbi:MAG: hypothetical protein LUO99_05915 [Methanomicrobiales archaeon]|nr:hypothetical protein [Methanomicrobiales archaeon]